jgi:hypothetical protein
MRAEKKSGQSATTLEMGVFVGPMTLEKVLEKLATTDKTTLVCEKAPDGKIRVTSVSWDAEKVILED